ncbi:MAG TPA: CBS domain-containing protein [Anaerolineales bacterium]|nr:CBS domain-containing protein [Anaerolineales bacterium]
MNISDCMKRNVISISETATVREAAAIVAEKHIGLLPIVDNDMHVIGVVGLKDLLSLELPDFVQFIDDLDFVHDFGAVETTRPPSEMLNKSITSLMKDAITVEEECGLMRAYALILQHNLHDMPVVSNTGKLTGVASRVDIGTAILSTWSKVE